MRWQLWWCKRWHSVVNAPFPKLRLSRLPSAACGLHRSTKTVWFNDASHEMRHSTHVKFHLTCQAFGLWEESKAPRGNPHRHGKNTQTPHREVWHRFNTTTSLLCGNSPGHWSSQPHLPLPLMPSTGCTETSLKWKHHSRSVLSA